MTALELFAILVLAGAVIVLLYFYLQDNRRISSSATPSGAGTGDTMSGITESVSGVGEKVTQGFSDMGDKIKGAGSKFTGSGEKVSEGETTSGAGEKVSEGRSMSGITESVSGMGEKIKGKVREVPISTDVLSGRIQSFLDEQSDQLIKDWDLATRSDLSKLEKRYDKVSIDLSGLEKRFNEYQGDTNKKIESIEDRLAKLENPE